MAFKIFLSPPNFGEASPQAVEKLKKAGYKVFPNTYGAKMSEQDVIRSIVAMDAIISWKEPLTRKVLEGSSLKVICRCGVGTDNVDVATADELGIKVMDTADAPVRSVAELTIANMIGLLRQQPLMNSDLHAGSWVKRQGLELGGKTVLIVGFGRVGKAVAYLLQVFGAKVLVCDPKPHELPPYVTPVVLGEGVRQADVITLHANAKHTLLTDREFSLIKKGVVILNSSNAQAIDSDALVEALDEGLVGGVWMDVFEQEPYTGPLTAYPQVLLSPHISAYSLECRQRMEIACADQLIQFFTKA